jgi:hypothetical protein
MKITFTDKQHKPAGEVEVIATSNPSLCIHRSLYADGSVYGSYGESWTVTHIPSGACILGHIPSMKIAQAAADWLIAQPLDWSLGYAEITKSAPKDFLRSIGKITQLLNACVESALDVMDEFGLVPKAVA